jgi:hypothetical protein
MNLPFSMTESNEASSRSKLQEGLVKNIRRVAMNFVKEWHHQIIGGMRICISQYAKLWIRHINA